MLCSSLGHNRRMICLPILFLAKNLINGMILLKTFINNRIKDFLGRVNNVENGGIIIWTLECKEGSGPKKKIML